MWKIILENEKKVKEYDNLLIQIINDLCILQDNTRGLISFKERLLTVKKLIENTLEKYQKML